MDLWDFFLTGIALSMDAVCVSITNGINGQNLRLKHALWGGIFFGFFQGLMPLIGYFAGSLFVGFLSRLSYLLVFAVFSLLGGKMIFDTLGGESKSFQKLSVKLLFLQAVATSIDALAVGVSLSVMKANILSASTVISVTTFFLAAPACLLGKQLGVLFQKKAGIFGGILLLLIGLKILLENTVFS